MSSDQTAAAMNLDPAPEPCSLIQAAYEQYITAFKDKDLDAIVELFTPNFEWKLANGESLDRAETEAAVAEQIAATQSVRDMSVTIERFTLLGEEAVVHIRERLVATVRTPDGMFERQTCVETYRDVWVKTLRGWRFKRAEVLTSKVTAKRVSPDQLD